MSILDLRVTRSKCILHIRNLNMKLFCLLTLSVFAVLFNSCKDDPVSPANGTIKGIIRDAETGKPIFGADIRTDPPTESVSTDTAGSYSITAKEGTYAVTANKSGYFAGSVSIRVNNGSATTTNISLNSILSKNKPPTTPVAINPLDGDTSAGKNPQLQWSCTDPDGDAITYTVYMDTVNPPLQKVADSLTPQTYKASGLKDSTFYYWKVIAKDRFGLTSTSPVFSFRTAGVSVTVPIEDDLLVYLPFDENTNDATGNLLIDNVPNVGYTVGVNGNSNSAVILDGTSNSYLQYKYNNKLDLPNEFTICAWVKPTSLPSTFAQIVGRWITAGGSGNATFSLTVRTTGQLEGNTHDGSVTTQATSNSNVPVSQWSHLVMLRESSGELRLYLNGTLVGTRNGSVPPQMSSVPLTIGRYGNVMGDQFRGAIDNVRIYTRALNGQEITSLFTSRN